MSAIFDESTQFIDESTGELLVNGYIYIGVENQDAKINPTSIYSDRDLTIALANPQRTGSDGRSLNKIWVADKYSMKVEDSRNVQKFNALSLGEINETGSTVLSNVQGINTITADASPAITVLADKQLYLFTAVSTNTGAMTLQIDSTPAYPIRKEHDVALIAGDIEANQIAVAAHNATDLTFELISDVALPDLPLTGGTVTGALTVQGAVVAESTLDVQGAFTSLGIDDNATSNAITIDASENVGIKNPSPASDLHIGLADSSTHEAELRLNSGGATGNHGRLKFMYEAGATPVAEISSDASQNNLKMFTANVERLHINSASIDLSTIALNEVKGSDVASATTTDIGATTGNFIDITGTTTITGLGTIQAGTRRTAQFDGALTLTYNATSLILPGNANITTAAGDVAEFFSLGSGNWICTNYQRDAANIDPAKISSASMLLYGAVQDPAVADTYYDFTEQMGMQKLLVLVPSDATTLVYQYYAGVESGQNGTVRVNGVNNGSGATVTNSTYELSTQGTLTLDSSELGALVSFTPQYQTTVAAAGITIYEFTWWFI